MNMNPPKKGLRPCVRKRAVKTQPSRKTIREKVGQCEYLTLDMFCGTCNDVIKNLQKLQCKYDNLLGDLILNVKQSYVYDDYKVSIKLFYDRPETDEEYRARVDKNEARRVQNQRKRVKDAASKEKRERAALRRLAKQYPEELQ